MNKLVVITGVICVASYTTYIVLKPTEQIRVETEHAKAVGDNTVKPVVSKSSVAHRMDWQANPPLTAKEMATAKNGQVARRIPYSQLSTEERKDPNFTEVIDVKTGRVVMIFNP